MENEVSPKSLSIRGTWNQQITGSVPDFDKIKFTVKMEDGESIKYDSWESFKSSGGCYSINGSNAWSIYEGKQTIEFYLRDYPSVKTSKEVSVCKKPTALLEVMQKSFIYAGDTIDPSLFTLRIAYSDGTYQKGVFSDVVIDPVSVPETTLRSIPGTFTYTLNGFSVSKVQNINVIPKRFTISIFSSEGAEAYVKNGASFERSTGYNYTEDNTFRIYLKTYSNSDAYRFLGWSCSCPKVEFDATQEVVYAIIPEDTGEDITFDARWDRYFDKNENKYTIENGALKSVKKVSSELIIPKEVYIIKEGFFKDSDATSIVLPEGITEIKKNTFKGSSIESIEISSSVTVIRESAFENCKNLKSVKFNQEETLRIEPKAFKGCTSLESVDFLALGRNFKDCFFGNDDRNVWTGCPIRTVKLDKSCFTPVKAISSVKASELSGDSGNGFRMAAKSSVRQQRILKVKYPSEIEKEIPLKDKATWNETFKIWSMENLGKENGSTCKLEADEDVMIYLETLGLGHPQFNYAVVSLPPCKYQFRTEDGGYVNDLLYPQIKFETLSDRVFDDLVRGSIEGTVSREGGSLLDRMLPLYRS